MSTNVVVVYVVVVAVYVVYVVPTCAGHVLAMCLGHRSVFCNGCVCAEKTARRHMKSIIKTSIQVRFA